MNDNNEEGEEAETSPEEAVRTKAECARQIDKLLQHISLNLMTSTVSIAATVQIGADLYGGDYAKGGEWNGLVTAVSSVLEFLLNPTVGCWSDAYGRKPTLMLGPISGVLTSILYCIR